MFIPLSHTHFCPSVSVVKPSVLTVLLAADLQGLRYTDSVEAALQMETENQPND